MKAMVVFEVDKDDLDDVVVYANVYKREQGWKRQIGRLECVKPMPMPTKKKPLFDPDHCEIEKEIKIVHEIIGYNRCIDEILGETE